MINNLIISKNNLICLKPEIESGNIEYKLRLDKKDDMGLKKTKSQILWRLNEGKKEIGKYEAMYIIGINDDGSLSNISENELNISCEIFLKLLKDINCKVDKKENYVLNNNFIIVLKISKILNDITETNIILLSPSNVGKTSLLSNLIHDQIDDGNGYSRILSLNHKHEKISGQTSSIKREFLGFKNDFLLNYNYGFGMDIDEIYKESDRYVTIDDLPGNFKYIKTIIYGILSINKDLIIISFPSIDTKNFIINNLKFYKYIFKICKVLNKNPLILFTKSDLITDKNFKIINLIKLVKSYFKLKNTKILNNDSEYDNKYSYFLSISNTKNIGIKLLIKFLSNFSKFNKKLKLNNLIETDKKMFITNKIFKKDKTCILYGTNIYNKICCNENVNIICNGNIFTTNIINIEKNLSKSEYILSGETGCIEINYIHKSINKSSILFNNYFKENLNYKFEFIHDYDLKKIGKNFQMYNSCITQPIILLFENNKTIIKCSKKCLILNNSLTILKDINNKLYIGKIKF